MYVTILHGEEVQKVPHKIEKHKIEKHEEVWSSNRC